MRSKAMSLYETFPADITNMRRLSRVDPLVHLQVCTPGEPPPAHFAFVVLIASVDHHVSFSLRTERKLLATNRALERPRRRVSLPVIPQSPSSAKRGPAFRTDVVAAIGVSSLVRSQRRLLGETPAARTASVGSLPRVESPVYRQVPSEDERHAANLASVFFHPRMDLDVQAQVGFFEERLVAEGTSERLQVRVHLFHVFGEYAGAGRFETAIAASPWRSVVLSLMLQHARAVLKHFVAIPASSFLYVVAVCVCTVLLFVGSVLVDGVKCEFASGAFKFLDFQMFY
jgi:hypothetical protein